MSSPGEGVRDYDLIVVGGGIVGLAAAAALAHTPVRVAVVERRPFPERPATDTRRVSALTAGSEQILRGMGASDALEPSRAGPIRSMVIWDGDAPGALTFGAQEIGRERLGALVPNGEIAYALLEAAGEAPNVDWYGPADWEDLHWEGGLAECRLARSGAGLRLRAPILAAADGSHSPVRQAVAIGTAAWDYGQSAVVAEIRPQRPHHHRAYQRFLRGGPLALLPLSGGRCSLVWTLPRARAEAMRELSDAAFGQRLGRAFGPELGALEVVGPRGTFPLGFRHARSYARGRVVLVGDAAHAIHPLAGLGLNLGLRDAAALAETVAEAHRAGEDPGSARVLGRYQRRRLPDNLLVAAYTDGLSRLFGQPPGLVKRPRALGMNLLDQSGPLKGLLMRQGIGLMSGQGPLFRGEPLNRAGGPKD